METEEYTLYRVLKVGFYSFLYKVIWSFRYLHGVLYKNRQVTDGNKDVVIEALRLLAEVLVWGDQNETSIFE